MQFTLRNVTELLVGASIDIEAQAARITRLETELKQESNLRADYQQRYISANNKLIEAQAQIDKLKKKYHEAEALNRQYEKKARLHPEQAAFVKFNISNAKVLRGQVQVLKQTGMQKIHVVKMLREQEKGFGLKEAKDLIDSYWDPFPDPNM